MKLALGKEEGVIDDPLQVTWIWSLNTFLRAGGQTSCFIFIQEPKKALRYEIRLV